MKPIDFSRVTFGEIAERLGDLRIKVWRGLNAHGPCTTSALSVQLEMSILTLRPRMTELVQMGLARLVPGQRIDHEGVYEWVSIDDAAAAQRQAVQSVHVHQLDLRIPA